MKGQNNIVKTIDLWKIYRVGKVKYPALRGVSLEIREGEFVGIVGPSGSGKTTLLNLIGALDRPTKGDILIKGISLSKLSGDELARLRNKEIGFVFQFYNLIPYMSALENVELPLVASGVSIEERRRRAIELLELFGLKDKIYKKPNELSGGEQQRVAISRALINDPSIILADEPTGNVDSKTGHLIVQTFRKLVDDKNVTIIMVTHNPQMVEYCDRIIYLKDGTIEREEWRK